MGMQVFSARVRDGHIVPEDGITLAEGAKVTVIAEDDRTFSTTAEEERELLDAIAEVERGDTVRAEDLIERLRR